MSRLNTLKPQLQTLSPTKTAHQAKKNWGQSRGGRPWRRKRDQIFKRDNYTCQVCNRVGTPGKGKTNSLELDHIINKAQGGTEDDANLQTICHKCHQAKTLEESKGGGYQKVW